MRLVRWSVVAHVVGNAEVRRSSTGRDHARPPQQITGMMMA
jgi:hypothetical protein